MEKAGIVWVIEHVDRELDVACATKYLLEKYFQLEVEIVSVQNSVFNLSRHKNPKLVIVPYFYGVKGTLLEEYVRFWPDASYFNLSWEQLFYKANQAYKRVNDNFTKTMVFHHVWGEFFKQILLDQGVERGNIFVNGHPAYKLYDEPYRKYFITRDEIAEKYSLSRSKPWIIFPENYGWGFYSNDHLERIVQRGADRTTVYELRDFCRESFSEVIRWCQSLANTGDVEIILRPRPTTTTQQMQEAIQTQIGNIPEHFYVIKDLTIRDWILAGDIIVSSYSTTLIEASVAGKAAFMLTPIPIPNSLATEWHDKVAKIKSCDEFMKLRDYATSSELNQNLSHWVRESLLANDDPIMELAKSIVILYNRTVIEQNIFVENEVRNKNIFAWILEKFVNKFREYKSKSFQLYEKGNFGDEEILYRVKSWEYILDKHDFKFNL